MCKMHWINHTIWRLFFFSFNLKRNKCWKRRNNVIARFLSNVMITTVNTDKVNITQLTVKQHRTTNYDSSKGIFCCISCWLYIKCLKINKCIYYNFICGNCHLKLVVAIFHSSVHNNFYLMSKIYPHVTFYTYLHARRCTFTTI